MNKEKLSLFLENARILRERLGIVPLLYGSLGLEVRIGEAVGADDIDILIPKAFITDRWSELKAVLEGKGYILTDEHEHTFTLDGVEYSYADIEDLEPFAGICLPDIEVCEERGVTFMLLTLSQYLSVYKSSLKDGYRINVRKKKDGEKIALIEAILNTDNDFSK